MRGIDISKHNIIRSFPAIKSQGVDFCIIRAGYGTIVDAKFEAHIKSARDAGMLVGVYWSPTLYVFFGAGGFIPYP